MQGKRGERVGDGHRERERGGRAREIQAESGRRRKGSARETEKAAEQERYRGTTRREGVAGERGCGVASVPAQWPGHRVLCLAFRVLFFSDPVRQSAAIPPQRSSLFTTLEPGVPRSPSTQPAVDASNQRLTLFPRPVAFFG